MKVRGFAHAVLLVILLVLVALFFLSAFLYTCFNQPKTEDAPSIIKVERPAPEQPTVVTPSYVKKQKLKNLPFLIRFRGKMLQDTLMFPFENCLL